MRIVLATRNRHKILEFQSLLDFPDAAFVPASDLPDAPEVDETGATFEANAILKATALARHAGTWALADDSGLEVDALGGAPGVYSARYAGVGATDAQHVAKLLNALGTASDRRARFRCVLALSDPEGRCRTVSGSCEGTIALEPRGTAGFGYDPVFVPNGEDRTFGEMRLEEKQQISHRGRAVTAARAVWADGSVFQRREQ